MCETEQLGEGDQETKVTNYWRKKIEVVYKVFYFVNDFVIVAWGTSWHTARIIRIVGELRRWSEVRTNGTARLGLASSDMIDMC